MAHVLAGRVLYVAAVGDRADWTGQFAQQLCHDWWMEPEVVTGLFALGGVILGSGATHLFGLVAARQKTQAEDDRRWLADRRTIYAAFLGLCESLLWESQKVVWALPRMWDEDVAAGEDPDPESYNDSLTNLIYEFHNRVDTELLTALGELQLMAGPQVADSAHTSALALQVGISAELEQTEAREVFTLVKDLVSDLRDAMRVELGLPGLGRLAVSEPDWLVDLALEEDRPERLVYGDVED